MPIIATPDADSGHKDPLSCVHLCMSLSTSRCSWQYTSVTMTSILLRSLLPQKRCAGMWWSCARSQGRWTAICLRCGVDLVRYVAAPPGEIFTSSHSLHTVIKMRFSAICQFAYGTGLYPVGQLTLVCLPPLMRGKLLFSSRPYMEISCVVNWLVSSFWRAYLFWVWNANEAKPIIPVTNTSSHPSPTSLR